MNIVMNIYIYNLHLMTVQFVLLELLENIVISISERNSYVLKSLVLRC